MPQTEEEEIPDEEIEEEEALEADEEEAAEGAAEEGGASEPATKKLRSSTGGAVRTLTVELLVSFGGMLALQLLVELRKSSRLCCKRDHARAQWL